MGMAVRRFTGTLHNFNRERGFGFVRVDGPFPEAMIHIKEFPKFVGTHELGPGVRIEFYLEHAPKGLKAIRANII